jgi:hypothetical protein|tara:strand:+ start:214 stop:315 length:102 start_codon:yes stop_codon:yes gene_type:complete
MAQGAGTYGNQTGSPPKKKKKKKKKNLTKKYSY